MNKINYIPHLDGLRAISIILVIFYHAELFFFSGGFIGVDIFFVISGYLISQIFHKNFHQNNFYFHFIESRVRRILPGIVLLCLATIPFSWLILFPNEIIKFTDSLISAPLFISNFTFYLQSNYFDKLAIDIPLLHTWSLSVEIQFYLMFVFLMFITSKISKNFKIKIIIFLFIILFFISYYFSTHQLRLENFYFSVPRFWEFLFGVLLYFYQIRKAGKKINFNIYNFLSISGVILIIISLIVIDKNSRFPGTITLLPVIGASLIILYSRNENLVGKVLSNNLFTYIGKISYSLYLWHYPVFSFYSLYFIKFNSFAEKSLLIFLSIVCATLSFHLFEQPLRNKTKLNLANFIKILSILLFIILSYSFIVKKFKGFDYRFSVKILEYLKVKDEKNFYPKIKCENKKLGTNCIINEDTYPNQIAIWGDSISNLAVDHFVKTNKKFSKSTLIYTYLGCPPFSFYSQISINCSERNKQILREIITNKKLSTIIIFGDYFQDTSSKHDKLKRSLALKRTIEAIVDQNKNVIFIHPIPKIKDNLPDLKARESRKKLNNEYDYKLQKYLSENQILFKIIKEIKSQNLFEIVTEDIFCSKSKKVCKTEQNNNLYYVDRSHPSQFIIKKIADELEKKMIKIFN